MSNDEIISSSPNSSVESSTSIDSKKSAANSNCLNLECISAQKSFLYCPKLKIYELNTHAYLPMSSYLGKNKSTKKQCETLKTKINRDHYEIPEIKCLHEEKTDLDDEYEDFNLNSKTNQEIKKTNILQKMWKLRKIKKQIQSTQENKPKCNESDNDGRSRISYHICGANINSHQQYNKIIGSDVKTLGENVESHPHYYEINLTDNNVEISDSEISVGGISSRFWENPDIQQAFLKFNDNYNTKIDKLVRLTSKVKFSDGSSQSTVHDQCYESLENREMKYKEILINEDSCEFLESNSASSAVRENTIAVEEYLEPRTCFDEIRKENIESFNDSVIKKRNAEPDSNIEIETSVSLHSSSNVVHGPETSRPFEKLQRWNEAFRNNAVGNHETKNKTDMLQRPLPVPVENEFYYMEVERIEAENLLEGQPNGTFILRPSSQRNHIYTLTLTYEGNVYNIGCRQRQDGRLALGFSKAGEPNFLTVHELIDYYYEEKLVILVNGNKIGSTVLKKLHP